jgi:hypothetical protein
MHIKLFLVPQITLFAFLNELFFRNDLFFEHLLPYSLQHDYEGNHLECILSSVVYYLFTAARTFVLVVENKSPLLFLYTGRLILFTGPGVDSLIVLIGSPPGDPLAGCLSGAV